MPGDYNFSYYFYAPRGRFEVCGMFTPQHITAALICIVSVILILKLTHRKINANQKVRLFRFGAILLTILESIKIAHSFIYKTLNLDSWLPLSYCGLFIAALWMSGFGKSYFKRAGEAYIAYGCPIAGLAFLIFPTTSLMSFPIWHYLSLYSLFYHSVMIFSGVIQLLAEKRLDKKTYLSYIFYVLSFAAIAITLNLTHNSNLMNLREPYNIPIRFLQDLYGSSRIGYTSLVLCAYMLIPAVIGFFTGKIKKV